MSPTLSDSMLHTAIRVGQRDILPCPTTRNIGFDSAGLTLRAPVSRTYMHLRNISAIVPALTRPSAECLMHALITARPDFCSSLYAGIPQVNLNKLRQVQKAAACLLTRTSRYYRSTIAFTGCLLHTEYDTRFYYWFTRL